MLLVFLSFILSRCTFFQEAISGVGAGVGSLDFLRNNPQVGFGSVNCYALNASKHFCSAYPVAGNSSSILNFFTKKLRL